MEIIKLQLYRQKLLMPDNLNKKSVSKKQRIKSTSFSALLVFFIGRNAAFGNYLFD